MAKKIKLDFKFIQPHIIRPVDDPVVFLAGPINGAIDWQLQAKGLLEIEAKKNGKIPRQLAICSPRGGNDAGWTREGQYKWEGHHLKLASRTGVIIFWLAHEDFHNCGRPFAQTTRLEWGEWMTKSAFGRRANIALGIHPTFSGRQYIRYRIDEDYEEYCASTESSVRLPKMPIFESLEGTCQYAAQLLARGPRTMGPGQRLLDALQSGLCTHCGKKVCDCAKIPYSLQAPDLVTDPRAVRCQCGQYLYPGEICRCKMTSREQML